MIPPYKPRGDPAHNRAIATELMTDSPEWARMASMLQERVKTKGEKVRYGEIDAAETLYAIWRLIHGVES
jgi:hypothetical protein